MRRNDESGDLRYVAIKIGICANGSISNLQRELNLSKRIATTNPSHPGAGYIRSTVGDFQLRGSQGIHTCLVYRPLRETLCTFRDRFINCRFPPKILKLYVILLLQALNYLHTECHLIHTGKQDIVFQILMDCTLTVRYRSKRGQHSGQCGK